LRGNTEIKFVGREFLIIFVFIAPLGGSVEQKNWSGMKGRRDLVGQWSSEGWERGSLFTSLSRLCPPVGEARGLLITYIYLDIADTLITQNLPSASPLCIPVQLLSTPFRAGWQQDRQRARCKLWEETGVPFPEIACLSSHLLSIPLLLVQS